MDENQVLNPFGFGEVSRVIDENRKPFEHWWWYVNLNAVFVENEFYILFSDGLLVKKGRSKFKTSQYLHGDRFKSFRYHYEKV
jgi:hypothetical protein